MTGEDGGFHQVTTKTNEDIVQEALTIIYEKYKEAKLEKGILPWAYKVLENVMKDDYRTEIRHHKKVINHKDKIVQIYANEKSVTDEVNHQELVDEVKMALRQLSSDEKEIFRLKLKGYSGEEIKDKLHLSRNVMDVRVYRGIRKLRRILEKRGIVQYEM